MGLFKNMSIKWTTNTVCKTYIKLKKARPDLNETEILQRLIKLRGPFWRLDDENDAVFKGYSAFIIDDDLQIREFIMLINIWESIIAAPKDIYFQSITKPELRELIVNIQTVVFDKLSPDAELEEILSQYDIVENYLNYSISVINKLYGKVL